LRSLQQLFVIRQNIVAAQVEMLMSKLPEAGSPTVLWGVLAKQIFYPDLKVLDVGLPDNASQMVFQANNALNSVLSDVAAATIRKRLSTKLTVQSAASDGWYSPQGGSKLIPFIQASGYDWRETVECELGPPWPPWDAKPIAQELEDSIGGIS